MSTPTRPSLGRPALAVAAATGLDHESGVMFFPAERMLTKGLTIGANKG